MQGLLRNKGRQQVRQRLLSNQKSPGDEMARAGLELTRITHTAVSGKARVCESLVLALPELTSLLVPSPQRSWLNPVSYHSLAISAGG